MGGMEAHILTGPIDGRPKHSLLEVEPHVTQVHKNIMWKTTYNIN